MAVDRRIPRQEDIYGFILLQIRRLCENTLEILVWIEVVFLSRFDDAESSRACLCARRCIGEEPVFSADDERLDASLSKVVVDLQPAVLNVTAQVRFFLDQIIYCLAKLALRRNVTERFCPRKERVQKRFCLLLSLFQKNASRSGFACSCRSFSLSSGRLSFIFFSIAYSLPQ